MVCFVSCLQQRVQNQMDIEAQIRQKENLKAKAKVRLAFSLVCWQSNWTSLQACLMTSHVRLGRKPVMFHLVHVLSVHF